MEPKNQRLFFRGIEKEDQVYLHMAGVKNNSKLLLKENSAAKEMAEEVKVPQISRGSEAVAEVRAEDDKLAEQASPLFFIIVIIICNHHHDDLLISRRLISTCFPVGRCFKNNHL